MFLAAFILLASSGFTVYEHHCSWTNTTDISYIVDFTDCSHNIDITAEEETSHNHNCCSHSTETVELEPISCYVIPTDGSTTPCCNTEAHFYKLIENFEVQPVHELIELQFIPILLAVINSPVANLLPGKFQQQILFDTGPPLLYGVALLRFIQQYKYHI